MNAQAFIGSKISLVSRAGIRYEGILFNIDSNNSTVALSKVKSFGTEDRVMDEPIPPRDEVYDYIMFRGSDIQDIHVSEYANRNTPLMSQDSAIIKVSGGSGGYGNGKHNSRPLMESGNYRENGQRPPFTSFQDVRYSSRYRGRSDMVSPRDSYESRRQSYHRSESPMQYYRGRSGSRVFGENSRHYRGGGRRRRGQSNSKQNPVEKKIPGGDYDFEAANAKMAAELERMSTKKAKKSKKRGSSKDTDNKEGSGDKASDKAETDANESEQSSNSVTSLDEPLENAQNAKPGKETCYDKKKSFFDHLSSEDNDRVRGRNVRALNWRDEKKLNSETFGGSQRQARNMYYGKSGYYYGGQQDRTPMMRMYSGGARVHRTPFWRGRMPLYEPRPILVGWR